MEKIIFNKDDKKYLIKESEESIKRYGFYSLNVIFEMIGEKNKSLEIDRPLTEDDFESFKGMYILKPSIFDEGREYYC